MQTQVMANSRQAGGVGGWTWLPAANVDAIASGVAILLLASGLIHFALLLMTGGSWQGPLSFRKPATFGLSFGMTLLTIVWVSHGVALSRRGRLLLIAAFAAASVLETLLVSLQAWRGVPSHFNVATAFDAWVTRGLAGGGIALVAMIVVLTIAAFRSPSAATPSRRLAVQAGFVALCGAMVVGGIMIARGMSLVVSGEAAIAYATGGLLKPLHAVMMHGILVLPLLAWLLARIESWSEERRVRAMRAAIAAYALLIAIVAATL